MKHQIGMLLALVMAFGGMQAQAVSEWNAADYDLYPGDFNGDGATDLL